MIREITVEELMNLEKSVLVDVRSEGEYQEATIPGALNLPLFNNDERAEIGTIYTQVSPTLAREEGLKIVSPKLPELIGKAKEWSEQGPLVLFCWRGGMRSKSLATVIDLMGVPVYRLQGGYKSYRKKVVEFFDQELAFKVIVLRGNTGVGKTEILKQLRKDGYPAIDLEGLANNRGSVFGDVGLGAAPSQKTFESLLYEELKRVRAQQQSYIVVECESKRIGRVSLPNKFHQVMQEGTQALVYDSIKNRVNRLLKEYTRISEALPQIKAALLRLDKNLGRKKLEEYIGLLEENRLYEFTEKLLEYYDALYRYPNEPSSEYAYNICQENPEQAIRELENYLDERMSESREASLPGVRNSAK